MGKTRLTYDYEGRHFCDYPTREIINRLAECEIMLEKIEQICNENYDWFTTRAIEKIKAVIEDDND